MIDIEALESMLNTAIDTVKLAEQKVREDEMANSL